MSDTIVTLEDQARLNLTNAVREQIIAEFTKDGLPEEDKDRKFLLAALDGLDRSVLTKTRIKVQDKSNQTQANAASLIAQLLYKISSNPSHEHCEREIVLSPEYAVENPVPGETDQGIQQLTYAEFFKG